MHNSTRLGDYEIVTQVFPLACEKLKALENQAFLTATTKQKEKSIYTLLLQLIWEEPTPCFLLPAVDAFFALVHAQTWGVSCLFSHFEFWLNHQSGLSLEDNYFVRAKIAGKYIPREAYQELFPLGMGKTYPGSHYVTAHSSPDLDTTVASFWGWIDAFAARVSEGLHLWNVPGEAPCSQVEVQYLFMQLLGRGIFSHFAKHQTTLTVSALDLVTKDPMHLKESHAHAMQGAVQKQAVLFVDKNGYYLGDWRPSDEEEVRKVSILLHNCLRFFASTLHKKLTTLFSQDKLTSSVLKQALEQLFAMSFHSIELVQEYTEMQRQLLDRYLKQIFHIQDGVKGSFLAFLEAMANIPLPAFGCFIERVFSLSSSLLFDTDGYLLERRALIFDALERSVTALEEAIQSLKHHNERLDVAFNVKQQLFSSEAMSVSFRAEFEEIRSRMNDLAYLTVTMSDADALIPMGIIPALVLTKPFVGTVSLRDFCNRDETKIPSYLEVISVIDHHKSVLTTGSAPMACIADAQSANALVAEKAFAIHDQFSVVCSAEELSRQYHEVFASKQKGYLRILKRLLQKQEIAEKHQAYFVDVNREYIEYLHYLYAILDDTDLLSKVSDRDVLCVVSLLNRMKSLATGIESEVLSLDDLSRDRSFATNAAKRILQNEEMYSLYRKIYKAKEEALSKSLRLCVKGEPTTLFADTKVQNGCNRVGQTKIFEDSFSEYLTYAEDIRALWYAEAKHYHQEHPECDVHMHMMSTVPSARSVYEGKNIEYQHRDELWIWIPETELATQHLKNFLNAFRGVPLILQHAQEMEVAFLSHAHHELRQLFRESFCPITERVCKSSHSIPVAVLWYHAGLLNSRKAMITPFLAKIVT